MSQLYARIFVQILDSSIAEDFTLRHVFEDFLKVCDYKTGVVDMTRQALSRRLNIPIEMLNDAITKLESPDPSSRDAEFEGRRIERLDSHRDWGWRIINWHKYEAIRTKASGAERAARFREKKAEPESDRKIAEWTTTPVQSRLNRLFKRRDTTRWSDKELKAFDSLGLIADEDMNAVEAYYLAVIPITEDYRRKDLSTFLNNFNGEVDRARRFSVSNKVSKAIAI